MKTFNDYQSWTQRTASYPTTQFSKNLPVDDLEKVRMTALSYTALGLNGEAGELADKIKRVIRGDYLLDEEKKHEIVKELGDVLWYVARVAVELDISLEYVADVNIDKLEKRLKDGVLKGSGDNR